MPANPGNETEAPPSGRPMEQAPLRATCWGTRGSIPAPGPGTVRYGGNTACLEVRTPDGCYVFDAGTGIRVLGERLAADPGATRVELFLTHFHWDHIQGLPFFSPLHDPGAEIRIHAPPQGGQRAESLLRSQMDPVHFPVPYDALAASLRFEALTDGSWSDGSVEVAAHRLRHPSRTVGYRIRWGTASVAYLPDNELVGGNYEVDGPDWYPGLVAFLRGVDLLFHDAMFTEAEYPGVEGWGHSTFRQAVRLAEEAEVGRLRFFHHAPGRTDDELDGILDDIRTELSRRGSALRVGIATEGEELPVPEP